MSPGGTPQQRVKDLVAELVRRELLAKGCLDHAVSVATTPELRLRYVMLARQALDRDTPLAELPEHAPTGPALTRWWEAHRRNRR